MQMLCGDKQDFVHVYKFDSETNAHLIYWFRLMRGSLYGDVTACEDLTLIDDVIKMHEDQHERTYEIMSFVAKHGSIQRIDAHGKLMGDPIIRPKLGNVRNLEEHLKELCPSAEIFKTGDDLKKYLEANHDRRK